MFSKLKLGVKTMIVNIQLRNISTVFSIAIVASMMIMFPLMAAEAHNQSNVSNAAFIVAHKDGGCGKHKMDSDGDGVISKDEFMAHAEKKFSKKDRNGDGVISKDEKKGMKKGDKDKCKKDKSHS